MKSDEGFEGEDVNVIVFTQQNRKIFSTDYFKGKEDCTLSNVQETSIDHGNLQACKRLQMYRTNIEALSTEELKNLEELVIFSGRLSDLDVSPLCHLKTLKIQACPISQLNLKSCNLIEHLDLSQTKLAELDTRNLKNVEELNFAGTSIRYLDSRQLIKLKKTTLSAHIRWIDVKCCENLQEITLGGGNLCFLRFTRYVQLNKVGKDDALRHKDFRGPEIAADTEQGNTSAFEGQLFFHYGEPKPDAEMNQINNYRRSYVVIDDDDANPEQIQQFDQDMDEYTTEQ